MKTSTRVDATINEATTVVVRGGEKFPGKLPPSVEPGEANPALEAMINEGQVRYHLDTLAELEAEAREIMSKGLGIDSMIDVSGTTTSGVPIRKLDAIARAGFRYNGLTSTRVDVTRGCGAAPCRTLGTCLCTCKRCRKACTSRK